MEIRFSRIRSHGFWTHGSITVQLSLPRLYTVYISTQRWMDRDSTSPGERVSVYNFTWTTCACVMTGTVIVLPAWVWERRGMYAFISACTSRRVSLYVRVLKYYYLNAMTQMLLDMTVIVVLFTANVYFSTWQLSSYYQMMILTLNYSYASFYGFYSPLHT